MVKLARCAQVTAADRKRILQTLDTSQVIVELLANDH